ncbi:hypothetical protein FIBSPDRAFT_241666 [Athelia psychrophila]|uniref:Uncharacterized protein n=1 Tax=Athelia psychrophila TaxID=1759441 RepID=A0A165Y6R2_9AGAM|nr:hypothetical protein FIBSPDRAFT_241666 [Fibularhizoctonia sp. CBS 109695]
MMWLTGIAGALVRRRKMKKRDSALVERGTMGRPKQGTPFCYSALEDTKSISVAPVSPVPFSSLILRCSATSLGGAVACSTVSVLLIAPGAVGCRSHGPIPGA